MVREALASLQERNARVLAQQQQQQQQPQGYGSYRRRQEALKDRLGLWLDHRYSVSTLNPSELRAADRGTFQLLHSACKPSELLSLFAFVTGCL